MGVTGQLFASVTRVQFTFTKAVQNLVYILFISGNNREKQKSRDDLPHNPTVILG